MDPRIKKLLLQKKAKKDGLTDPEEIQAVVPFDPTSGGQGYTPPSREEKLAKLDALNPNTPNVPKGTPNRDLEPTRFIVTDGNEFDSSREDTLHKVQDAGWKVLIRNLETNEEDIVTPQNLHKAEAAGWSPVTEFDYKLKEQFKADKQLYEDTKESGGMSALRGAADAATLGFDDEIVGGISAIWAKVQGDERDMSQIYEAERDTLRYLKDRGFDDNTAEYIGGSIVGSLAPGAAAGKMIKAGNLGAKGIAGLAAGEGALYGAGSSKEDDIAGVAKDMAIGGTIGGVIGGAPSALKYAGDKTGATNLIKAGTRAASTKIKEGASKFASKAGKFVPGSEAAKDGLVNKVTAWVSGKLPINSFDEDEIYELLNNPDLRKKVAKNEGVDVATLRNKLTTAFNSTDDDISRAYQHKEEAFTMAGPEDLTVDSKLDTYRKILNDPNANFKSKQIAASTIGDIQKDLTAYTGVGSDIQGVVSKIKKNPNYYSSSTKKLINNISDMLDGGSTPVENESGNYKKTLLVARRYLDDATKSKNFENMGMFDREAILNSRKAVDDRLKYAMSRSEEMLDADGLYREYRELKDRALDPIKGQGKNSVSRPKLDTMMRSQREKSKEFFEHLGDFEEFIKNNPMLNDNESVDAAITAMKEIKDEISFRQLQYKIDKSGGPSSPELRNISQAVAAIMSGGKSLLLGPITNPAQYVRTKDALNELVKKGILPPKLVLKLTNSIEKATPAVRSALVREAVRQKNEQ